MIRYYVLLFALLCTLHVLGQGITRNEFVGEWEGTLFQKPNREYFFTIMLDIDTSSNDRLIGISGIRAINNYKEVAAEEGDVGMMLVEASVQKGKLNFEEKSVIYQSKDSTRNYYWCIKKSELSLSTENGMQVLRGKWWADDKGCNPGHIYLVNSKHIQFKHQKAPTYLNATLLEKTLEEMEITFESRGFNKYKLKLKDYIISVDIDNGIMILRAMFNADISLDKINEYNKTYRWARTYFNRDGDLVLEDELSLTGGIHEQNIKAKIKQFGQLLEVFTNFMNE